MEDSTLKQLWLDAGQQQKLEINTGKLIESIHHKVAVLENQIKKRNALEIIVSLFLILQFGWFLLTLPQTLGKVGAAIIIANCILVIFRLIYASKINVIENAALEINQHLKDSLQQVRKQIALLNTVLWWYLLPFFIGVICFYYSFPVSFLGKGIYTLLIIALYYYIYYLNKRVVSKTLKPLEGSIVKALEELAEVGK